ncbi:MAG: reprolysin-like metallopeptidase [Chitinophagales bacterium]
MKQVVVIIIILLLCSCNKFIIRYAGEADVLNQDLPFVEPGCKFSENYITDPSHPSATPVRYIRINFHIMQRSDGSGSFNEAEGKKFCRELVEQSNYRWANNFQMNLPVGNSTPALPIQIRVVLQKDITTGDDAIYFHKNDSLAFWNRSLKKGYASLSDKTVINKYTIGTDSIINLFLMEHDPDSIGSKTYGDATLSGISFVGSIKLFSFHYQHTTVKYRDDGTPFTHDALFLSKLMNHEIGHSLGINHTWAWDDGCDDTPKNPGCWSETGVSPCDGVISNNMMDYNWSQQAVSPCQIGKIQYNFYKDDYAIRKFAIPYWCEYHSMERIIIYKNENVVWNGGKDLWGDIELRSGATLTIRCMISLPEEAKIMIKPGAKLIIDGGTITNRCGDKFDGIQIYRNRKTDEIGQIIISNNGSIQNAVHYKLMEE